MLVSEAIPHILNIVQNKTPEKTALAMNWLQATINEVDRRTRLTYWARQTFQQPIQTPMAKPTCKEILDPLMLDVSVDPATTGLWVVPAVPPSYNQVVWLRLQSNDYITSSFGIEISDKWTTGMVYVETIRNLRVPVIDLEAIDLPDMFVFDLAVYGAARHGLIQEDDYDRLQWATGQFEKALADLVAWDSREGVANARAVLRKHNPLGDAMPYPVFPSNFSL